MTLPGVGNEPVLGDSVKQKFEGWVMGVIPS